MTKFERVITKKMIFFFKFSPGNLLFILYKLSKFEAPSCNGFGVIKFSMSKFANGNNSKNVVVFLILPGNLFIISFKLSMFEAPSC